MIITNALISQWLHTVALMITWQKKKCGNWKDDDLWPSFCTFHFCPSRQQEDTCFTSTFYFTSLLFGYVCRTAHSKGDNACTVTANVIILCGVWWPWLEKCCFLKNKQSFKLLMHLFNLFPSLFLFLKSGRKICTYFTFWAVSDEKHFFNATTQNIISDSTYILQNLTSIDLM